MKKITTRMGTIGAFGAAAALATVAIAAPAQASEIDYTETSSSSHDSYQGTIDGLSDILNGAVSGNTGTGILGNDFAIANGGFVNGPLVSNVGNGTTVGNGIDVPVGNGNDVPLASGNDTSVEAPVDAPIEAPVDLPVQAPVEAPVGNGTDTDSSVGGSSVDGIDAEIDNMVDDVLGGLGLGLGD